MASSRDYRIIRLNNINHYGELIIEQDMQDGWINIQYNIPAFYARQYGIREWFSLLWDVVTGKQHRLFDIIIGENDVLQEFRNAIIELRPIEESN